MTLYVVVWKPVPYVCAHLCSGDLRASHGTQMRRPGYCFPLVRGRMITASVSCEDYKPVFRTAVFVPCTCSCDCKFACSLNYLRILGTCAVWRPLFVDLCHR